MWFVGFPSQESGQLDQGARLRWWRWFTRPGYRHVCAWCAAGDGGALFLDPLAGRLTVEFFPMPVERVTRHFIDAGVWTLAYAAPAPNIAARPTLRPLVTCTEIVKSALGLRAWHVITPHQLARELRRRGAVPVLPLSQPVLAAKEP